MPAGAAANEKNDHNLFEVFFLIESITYKPSGRILNFPAANFQPGKGKRNRRGAGLKTGESGAVWRSGGNGQAMAGPRQGAGCRLDRND